MLTFNSNLIEAWNDLEKMQWLNEEELEQTVMPPEVAALIQQGVPVYKDEPSFLRQESTLSEATSWTSGGGAAKHERKHLATHLQNLTNFRQQKLNDIKFTSHWSSADYTKHAIDLVESPIDSSELAWVAGRVGAFICHDTLRDSNDTHKTAKRSSGETRSEKDTAYRICKYRLNKSLFLAADELYTTDGSEVTDFNFGDNGIFEVVYYAPEASYSGTALQYVKYNNNIISYLPKSIESLFKDIDRVKTDVSPEKFRTFKNQVDYSDLVRNPKIPENDQRQPVNIVLEFEVTDRVVATRATFYNNEAAIQKYLSTHETAFFACVFDGNNYQLWHSTLAPVKENEAALKWIVNNINTGRYRAKDLNTELWANTLLEKFDKEDYLSDTMTPQKILAMLNAATTQMEKKYVRETQKPVRYFYIDTPESAAAPLGTIVL